MHVPSVLALPNTTGLKAFLILLLFSQQQKCCVPGLSWGSLCCAWPMQPLARVSINTGLVLSFPWGKLLQGSGACRKHRQGTRAEAPLPGRTSCKGMPCLCLVVTWTTEIWAHTRRHPAVLGLSEVVLHFYTQHRDVLGGKSFSYSSGSICL